MDCVLVKGHRTCGGMNELEFRYNETFIYWDNGFAVIINFGHSFPTAATVSLLYVSLK